MAVVVALLVVSGLWGLERTRRPGLQPLRERWCRLRARIVAFVRAAPGTFVYLFVVSITTWVVQGSSSRVGHALLEERSTNLHHLAHEPVRVLVASAFWLSTPTLFFAAVLFGLVLAPVEQWIGTVRWLAVFAAGHVGATLLTDLGIALAIHLGFASSGLAHAIDVGVSYGFVALAAVLTFRLPRRWRWRYVAVLLGALVALAVVAPDFTDFGHLVAVAIGFACYPVVRHVPVPDHVPGFGAARSTPAPVPRDQPGC